MIPDMSRQVLRPVAGRASRWRRIMTFGFLSLGLAVSGGAATTVFESNFQYPAYGLGLLSGQNGWYSALAYSTNAAQLVAGGGGQILQLKGPLVQSNGPILYECEFLNSLSNYDPVGAGTPVVTVSGDLWLNLGPAAGAASWLNASLVLNDQNGNPFAATMIDRHGMVSGENLAGTNVVVWSGLTATNGFHNLRADLNFTNHQITFYLDGVPYGTALFNLAASNLLGSVGLILQSSNPLDSSLFAANVSVTAAANVAPRTCALTIAKVVTCLPDGTPGTPSIGEDYGLLATVNVAGNTAGPFRMKWTMANTTFYFDNINLSPGNGYTFEALFDLNLDDPIPFTVTIDPDDISGNTNFTSNTFSGTFTPVAPATPTNLYAPRMMHGLESYSLGFASGTIQNLYLAMGEPTSHGAQCIVSTTDATNGSVVITAPYGEPVFLMAPSNVPSQNYQGTNYFTAQLSRVSANAALLRTNTWAGLGAMTTNWTVWLAPDARNESTNVVISNFVAQALPANYRTTMTPYDAARTLHRAVMRALTYQSPPFHIDAVGVLQDGVADCGGYSSLLVSSLRQIGIPARCISGFREGDAVWHIRVEFHLPGVNWIVDDATDGNAADPTGTYAFYFGNLDNSDGFFAMDTGDSHEMSFADLEFLQVPNYLWYGTGFNTYFTYDGYLGPNGVLALTNGTPGNLNFSLRDVPGEGTVVLQNSTNLVNWLPIATNTAAGQTLNYSYPRAGKAPQFYRTLVSP